MSGSRRSDYRARHEPASRSEVDEIRRLVVDVHRAVVGTTEKLHQDGIAGMLADAIQRIANLERAAIEARAAREESNQWTRRTVVGAMLTVFAGAVAGAIVTRVAILLT